MNRTTIRLCSATALVLALGSNGQAAALDSEAACAGPPEACQQNVALWKSWETAFNRRDAASTAALFTQDAVWVLPGATASGTQAIEKALNDALKAGWKDAVANVDEVHVVGDFAWVVGHWSETGPGPNNTTKQYEGKWGSVHMRDGGGWKIRMSTPNISTQ